MCVGYRQMEPGVGSHLAGALVFVDAVIHLAHYHRHSQGQTPVRQMSLSASAHLGGLGLIGRSWCVNARKEQCQRCLRNHCRVETPEREDCDEHGTVSSAENRP